MSLRVIGLLMDEPRAAVASSSPCVTERRGALLASSLVLGAAALVAADASPASAEVDISAFDTPVFGTSPFETVDSAEDHNDLRGGPGSAFPEGQLQGSALFGEQATPDGEPFNMSPFQSAMETGSEALAAAESSEPLLSAQEVEFRRLVDRQGGRARPAERDEWGNVVPAPYERWTYGNGEIEVIKFTFSPDENFQPLGLAQTFPAGSDQPSSFEPERSAVYDSLTDNAGVTGQLDSQTVGGVVFEIADRLGDDPLASVAVKQIHLSGSGPIAETRISADVQFGVVMSVSVDERPSDDALAMVRRGVRRLTPAWDPSSASNSLTDADEFDPGHFDGANFGAIGGDDRLEHSGLSRAASQLR